MASASPEVDRTAAVHALSRRLLAEVSPPGWEGTVKRLKKHPEIDNPWALAWWMHGQGASPSKSVEQEETDLCEHDGPSCSHVVPVVRARLLRDAAEAQTATALAPLLRQGVAEDSSGDDIPNAADAPVASFRADLDRKEDLYTQSHDDKQPKETVNYRYADDPTRSCAMCRHFQPAGTCELVVGLIRPIDVCDLWEPAVGEAGVEEYDPGQPRDDTGQWSLGRSGPVRARWKTMRGRDIPIEREEPEDARLVDRFTKRETPEERAARIRKKRIDPETAAAIRKAFAAAA